MLIGLHRYKVYTLFIITKKGRLKMKSLYLDCFSGISGDMFIGALLDAGGDRTHLETELKKLALEGEYTLTYERVIKNGITSTKFNVVLDDEQAQHQNHSHDEHHHDDHAHDHSHSHDHNHDGHSHAHDHGDVHDDDRSNGHHHHHHDDRTYKHIVKLIQAAGLLAGAERIALQIFEKIGIAEGKIHGVSLDHVHFHEVGAVDSIIDIVGAAILIDQMGIEKVYASAVPVGSGRILIDHGLYPVPAPATLEILRGIPLNHTKIKGELTTPTGAAIVAVLAEEFGPVPSMIVEEIGYGAGTKTFPTHPNVLRVMVGHLTE